MIRYELDPVKLRTDIEKIDQNWFRKAEDRTNILMAKKRFGEESSIWSSAKPAFMIAQRNKCVFCERSFSGPEESRIDMDLEHFRPKSSVKEWKPATGTVTAAQQYGAGSANGYYWLAYDINNYAASCKTCNSEYKGTYFPIAGLRCEDPADAAGFIGERPYLIYPLGTLDDNPESLITFTGTVARPVEDEGPKRERASLVIEFFGLNARDQLHIQRAETIERFGKALIAVADGTSEPSDVTYVDQIYNALIPHAGCLRAFKRLWDHDQAGARRIYNACRTMLSQRLLDPTARGLGVGLA